MDDFQAVATFQANQPFVQATARALAVTQGSTWGEQLVDRWCQLAGVTPRALTTTVSGGALAFRATDAAFKRELSTYVRENPLLRPFRSQLKDAKSFSASVALLVKLVRGTPQNASQSGPKPFTSLAEPEALFDATVEAAARVSSTKVLKKAGPSQMTEVEKRQAEAMAIEYIQARSRPFRLKRMNAYYNQTAQLQRSLARMRELFVTRAHAITTASRSSLTRELQLRPRHTRRVTKNPLARRLRVPTKTLAERIEVPTKTLTNRVGRARHQ